jgi:hypothetical protein
VLDPAQSHGLGDVFLKHMLKRVPEAKKAVEEVL